VITSTYAHVYTTIYLPNIQTILQEDVPLGKDLAILILKNAIQSVLLNIMMVMGLVLMTWEIRCAFVPILLVE
jgi:hypothetical protein